MEDQNHMQEKVEPAHVHGPGCSHHHQAPFVRKDVKVGRNDPCPCGSEQKFKKCCGKGV